MSAAPAGQGEAFHIPSLDGIRAVSFLLVFAAHAGLERIVPGGFGVTVFFFLSGYLITTLMRREREKTSTVSLRQFYLRRALRILPPFYLVLGLASLAASVGVLAGGVSPRALAAQALHLANYWVVLYGYGGQASGTGVYWSLAVEEHFYLVFPLIYLFLSRSGASQRKQANVVWGLAFLVLAWRCVLVYGIGVSTDRTYVASDTRVDSILFGCALALAGNPMLDAPSRMPSWVWKGVLLPAGLFGLLVSFVYRDPAFRETFRYTLQGISLLPIFVVAMRYPTWGPFKLLNHRWASFIGVLSYSLYLVHHVVIRVLDPLPIGAFGRGLVALALSVALSWLIYRFVEKPCAKLRKRLSSERPATKPRSDDLAALAGAER